MEEYIIITFQSTNFAMQAESELKASGISHQIIPTPRQITLSCGLSIMTSLENLQEIRKLIESGKVKNKAIYKAQGAGKDRTLEEIRE